MTAKLDENRFKDGCLHMGKEQHLVTGGGRSSPIKPDKTAMWQASHQDIPNAEMLAVSTKR